MVALPGEMPDTCTCVLIVSIGNINECSVRPARLPATACCQKAPRFGSHSSVLNGSAASSAESRCFNATEACFVMVEARWSSLPGMLELEASGCRVAVPVIFEIFR